LPDRSDIAAESGMQLLQLPESNRLHIHNASHPLSFEQGLCIAATKTQDHDNMLTVPVMNRKPPFRAEALGFRTVTYRTVSTVLAALFATVAGALLALWLRYTGPDTTLSFEIMLDILLIVVIGGMGTLYGAVIGSVLFVLAQNYLQDLLKLAAGAVEGVPVLAAVLTPDRWLLWLGVLFVLSVYHFPTGVVGRLRARVKIR
jgi:branched-chain amino acid transport system permease protein